MNKLFSILLVEDNLVNVYLLKEILLKKNYEFSLLHVSSLNKALELLQRENFGIILLDISLSDSQGIDTLLELQKQALNTPIILLSNLEGKEIAIKTIKESAQDYIVKGKIDNDSFIHAICHAIEHKTKEQTLQTKTHLIEDLVEPKNLQKSVIQQERLQALGKMASGIAYDFNNSLAPILGFSELILANNFDDPEKIKHYLKLIHIAAQDASNTVHRLREFSLTSKDRTCFQPVQMAGMVQEVISLTQPKWKNQSQENGITIDIKTNLQQIPCVYGNESELRGMLTNLIFNAVEAIRHKGTIKINTYQEKKFIVIEVSDDGIGMTEQVRLHCLEPFFSNKDTNNNSGLGLSMVFGTVQRMEGKIEIKSKWGEGTSVFIFLPFKKVLNKKSLKAPTKNSSRSLHILVVENNPLVAKALLEYLHTSGHTTEMVDCGQKAIKKFCEKSFDLIITDKAMPQMNGIQLATIIKQISPKQPIVLLIDDCCEANPTNAVSDKPEAIDFVINKPVNFQELKSIVLQLKIDKKTKALANNHN